MAHSTGLHSHDDRSSSPVAGSGSHTKQSKLLGAFHRVYQQFPELHLDNQHLVQGESHRLRDDLQKGTTEQRSPPSMKHRTIHHYNGWESHLAMPDRSSPKLGKLDKLLLLYPGNSKATLSELSSGSTTQVCSRLQAPFQNPHPAPPSPASRQNAYSITVQNPTGRASLSTNVENDSPNDADDGSMNDPVSKATTPATSPDFTLGIQAKIDAIVNDAAIPTASRATTIPSPLKVEVVLPAGPWPGANLLDTPQGPNSRIPQLHFGLSPAVFPSKVFQERSQRYRSNIATRVANDFAILRPGEEISLPWDEHGNYTVIESPSHQRLGTSYGNKSAYIIEPLYRVDKRTQLMIVKARIAQMDFHHQLEHARSAIAQADPSDAVVDPVLHDKHSPPVHVFVDMSNIVIGFYNYMRQERNLTPQQRIQAPFFFEALAAILERERPCVKRVIVGSMGPGAPWEDHMFEAQSQGYTMHILQRVRGVKPSRTAAATARASPSTTSFTSGSVHHEQGVDEILQLHMMLSIVDTPTPFSAFGGGEAVPPGTMVLATGDGAEAEFSDGFFNHVLRALKHGWCVEVVGFQSNMNQVWNEQAIPAEWRARFRKIFLDDFAEELLASFR